MICFFLFIEIQTLYIKFISLVKNLSGLTTQRGVNRLDTYLLLNKCYTIVAIRPQ